MAKVARVAVALAPVVTVTVCSPATVPVGLHSLYVGVPNAVLVVSDKFK